MRPLQRGVSFSWPQISTQSLPTSLPGGDSPPPAHPQLLTHPPCPSWSCTSSLEFSITQSNLRPPPLHSLSSSPSARNGASLSLPHCLAAASSIISPLPSFPGAQQAGASSPLTPSPVASHVHGKVAHRPPPSALPSHSCRCEPNSSETERPHVLPDPSSLAEPSPPPHPCHPGLAALSVEGLVEVELIGAWGCTPELHPDSDLPGWATTGKSLPLSEPVSSPDWG